ncbi:MAG: hypothetical protein V1885_03430 [Candidatus Brennerbacteria bacterium]
MRTLMRALIRAPITAIVLVIGMLAVIPAISVARAHDEAPATSRAAPIQIGMEYSEYVAVDLIEETAIGEPVARAAPIEAYDAMSIRQMDLTSSALTTYDYAYTTRASPTAKNVEQRECDTTFGVDSNFAMANDATTGDLTRATARNGSHFSTTFC